MARVNKIRASTRSTLNHIALTCLDGALRRYLQEVYLRFDPPVRRLVIIDQINPQWAKYYQGEEIKALVRDAGFADVRAHHRHGYSWTVIGRKPG